jgi:hypothetical protein
MPTYTQLDEALIIRTIEELRDRIGTTFPDAGLRRVCEQFLGVSKEATNVEAYLRRPNWAMRALGIAAIVALTTLLASIVVLAIRSPAEMSAGEVIQTIEAAVNDIVFFGIAVFFLLSIETRVKRHRALVVLHELRSLAHIVDMHQLTKDPERLRPGFRSTHDSFDPHLERDELERYLDYCSELLSLIGKVAALCAEESQDAVVLDTVSTIETLTTSMSRKIWQKISLLPD